jgi:hypothetical protein
MRVVKHVHGTFSKLLYIVTLYRRYTMALTFENGLQVWWYGGPARIGRAWLARCSVCGGGGKSEDGSWV